MRILGGGTEGSWTEDSGRRDCRGEGLRIVGGGTEGERD